MEEIDLILEDTKERMEKSIQFLMSELKKIRAGKATPSMLDSVMVDYYGSPTPILRSTVRQPKQLHATHTRASPYSGLRCGSQLHPTAHIRLNQS